MSLMTKASLLAKHLSAAEERRVFFLTSTFYEVWGGKRATPRKCPARMQRLDSITPKLLAPTGRLPMVPFLLLLEIVSQCVDPSGSFSKSVYAYAQIVVLVTSQVKHSISFSSVSCMFISMSRRQALLYTEDYRIA
ncbi:hypothetical protein POM88_043192 [Heracleum sosnowskyi]|uniref:Uncharacterized protein n=1 Tax=Heracleum sosnowskyi TaxID=360622 RepID=A0AAD8H1Y7_9APIA|nr:hypothetical protein POM88_043192 [Heracleum sosnowskyi]